MSDPTSGITQVSSRQPSAVTTRRDLSRVTRWHWQLPIREISRNLDHQNGIGPRGQSVRRPALKLIYNDFGVSCQSSKPDGILRKREDCVNILHEPVHEIQSRCQESGGITLYLPVPDKPGVGADTDVLAGDCTDTLAGTGLRFSHVEAEGEQETQVVHIRPEGRRRDRCGLTLQQRWPNCFRPS